MLSSLLSLLLTIGAVQAEEPDWFDDTDPRAAALLGLIDGAKNAEAKLQDTTFTFSLQEYWGKKMQAPQTIEVKFRRPHHTYMRWVDDVHPGRHLLYKQGWNDGRIRVKPSGWLPVLNLDPRGMIAMRGSRHSALETGFSFMVGKFSGDSARVLANPDLHLTFADYGTKKLDGADAHCFDVKLPKDQDPGLYAHRLNVCVNLSTGLPATIKIWDAEDGEVQLVGEYGYLNVRVNPGLTDMDFDPENPDYPF
jgi:outer membrane lipoprotein-sorting protein